MTKQILIDEDKLKLALKELETWKRFTHGKNEHTNKAIKALEEALAKQEQGEPVAHHLELSVDAGLQSIEADLPTTIKQEKGEPVAWMDKNKFEHLKKNNAVLTTVTSWSAFDDDVPLYTTPYIPTGRQQRPFIKPLTDVLLHLFQEWKEDHLSQSNYIDAVEQIKAAHGITSATDFKE